MVAEDVEDSGHPMLSQLGRQASYAPLDITTARHVSRLRNVREPSVPGSKLSSRLSGERVGGRGKGGGGEGGGGGGWGLGIVCVLLRGE